MADNIGYTPGAGATIAADDVGGVLYQRVKLAAGLDGSATDVSPDAPLPVAAYGELIEAIQAMRMAVQALTRTMGQMQPDTAARMRVNVEAGTLPAVTTVGTVTTVGRERIAVTNDTVATVAGGTRTTA